jgi:hypothetical protein
VDGYKSTQLYIKTNKERFYFLDAAGIYIRPPLFDTPNINWDGAKERIKCN